MYNTPIYYFFLFLHIMAMVVGFGAVIVIDSFGLLWLTKLKKIDLAFLTRVADVTQMLIWLGWGTLVVTGSILLYMKGSISTLTQIKLFLVALVGLNGVFMHVIKKSMEAALASGQLSAKVMFRIGLASFISQLGWWGATIIGFLNRQVKPHVPAGLQSWQVMAGICLLIAVIALVGETTLRKRTPHLQSSPKPVA